MNGLSEKKEASSSAAAMASSSASSGPSDAPLTIAGIFAQLEKSFDKSKGPSLQFGPGPSRDEGTGPGRGKCKDKDKGKGKDKGRGKGNAIKTPLFQTQIGPRGSAIPQEEPSSRGGGGGLLFDFAAPSALPSTTFTSHKFDTASAVPQEEKSSRGGGGLVFDFAAPSTLPRTCTPQFCGGLDLRGDGPSPSQTQKPKASPSPWTFDAPTFGEDFCSDSRASESDNPKKRKGRDEDSPSHTTEELSYPGLPSDGFGFGSCGFGGRRPPTESEIDAYVDFADRWIPTGKRRKVDRCGSGGSGSLGLGDGER